jgi:hypothetical protein
MAKNNLLKEAIADAKAVRETALANAKIALEEAFTPRIQSMLSAKLAEEEEMEDEMEAPAMAAEMDHSMEDEAPKAEEGRGSMNDADQDPTDMHSEEMESEDPAEPVATEARGEKDIDEEEEMELTDDLELEAIIKELEEEMESDTAEEPVATEARGEKEVDEAEESDKEDPVTEADDEPKVEEDINLDEIISALREEDGDKEEKVTEEDENEDPGSEELKEAYDVIRFLKSKINEVNLLNAKLLFSNKLFRNHSMNENQKMKVIENFDRASNLREVKLVFATLSESFNLNPSRTKRSIKESYSSKSSASTAPSKKVISEGNDLAARWKKLANL